MTHLPPIRRAAEAVLRLVRDLPIRTLLIISFSIVAFIPALSIALLSYQRSRTVLEGTLTQYSLSVLDELSRTIEYRLDEVRAISYLLFPNADVQQTLQEANRGFPDDYARVTQTRKVERLLLNSLLGRTDIDAVWLRAAGGDTFAATLGLERPDLSLSDVERELLAAERGGPRWLAPRPGRRVVPLARAVNDLNTIRPIGYLVIDLREESLFDLYADLYGRIRGDLDGELFIVDGTGRIVSHADKSLIGSPAGGAVERLPAVTGSGYTIVGPRRSESYVYWYTLRNSGWKIVGVVPAIQYRKDIVGVRDSILLLALAVLAASVLLAAALARGISRPIRALSQAMQRAGQGQFAFEPPYRSRNEVGVLHERFAVMLREIDDLIRTVYREELALREAELKSLRMQINPHFLYNTLESINWLARLRGVPEIGTMAKALGDLMRASISGGDTISLAGELEIVRNYLAIQQFRYRDRFTAELSVAEGLSDVPIPKLILQPLVENAIVHGMEPKKGPGRISVSASADAGRLRLEVRDDGVGMDAAAVACTLDERPPEGRSATIGLRNVHQRIRMRYGEPFGLTLYSEPGSGTRVTLVLPVEAGESPAIGSASEGCIPPPGK